MNKKVLWITRTAIFIALIIVVQFATRGFSSYVTGSLVNLLLIIGGLTAGLSSGLTLAVLSPVFALILGIQPPQTAILVPAIMIGNMVIVFVTWYFTKESLKLKPKFRAYIQVLGLVTGAVLKFFVLWALVTQILLPIAKLPIALSSVLAITFSWAQLITALIGGSIALSIYPLVAKGIKSEIHY